MNTKSCQAIILWSIILCSSTSAADAPEAEPKPITHRVTGLFSPDRVDDLKTAMKAIPDIKLVAVDYDKAEASFTYDMKKAFNTDKPELVVERFSSRLRSVSRDTFGIKAPPATPREKLSAIEIAVVGLDCKGCAWAAYSSIYKLEGVEQATVSFKDGRVTALIDPARTSKAALEAALKQRGVQLKAP